MKKQEIESAVKDYIESKDTDYAIMITGEWGVGKTYFLKKNLYETFKKANLIPIYVSLIGYSSISTLMDSIFSKINPLYQKSKEYSKVKSEGKYIENILLDEKQKRSLIPSNYILCFDDLERINPSFLERGLGYINSFIEHEGVKTIFLCNNNKMHDKERFEEIKEKYIRFSYQFEPNIRSYLHKHTFHNNNPNKEINIPIDKKLIETVLLMGSCQNIRTIKYLLNIYYRIYQAIEKELNNRKYGDQILISIQLFTFILGIEKERRIILFEEYREDTPPSPPNDELLKNFEHNIDSKYFEFSNLEYRYFHTFKSILHFLVKGYLDEDDLKSEVLSLENKFIQIDERAIKKKAQSKEQILLDKLRQPELLDDVRYKELRQEIRKGLRTNTFSLANIIPMYSYLIHLESYSIKNVRLDESSEILFRRSIKYLVENKDLSELPTSFFREQYYWGDKSQYAERFKDFINFTFDLLEEKQKGKSVQAIEDFIDRLKKNTIILTQLDFSNINSEEWIKEENVKSIFEALKTAHPQSVLNFKDFLRERYSIKDHIIPNELRNEQSFIEALHKLIDVYIEGLDSFQKISLKMLNNILSEAIKLNKRLG